MPREVVLREPAMLFRVNKRYREGMAPIELYDATRSAWRVGPRADGIKLALPVFEGVVLEVYRITQWLPAGTTFVTHRWGRASNRADRKKFVGVIAEEKLRRLCVGGYVGYLFRPGARSPFRHEENLTIRTI